MLGKVEQVDLRAIWKHEAVDFTNRLAEEDHFRALSDKIGIDMQVLKTEASVPTYLQKCLILAKR